MNVSPVMASVRFWRCWSADGRGRGGALYLLFGTGVLVFESTRTANSEVVAESEKVDVQSTPKTVVYRGARMRISVAPRLIV